jgi:hypothetical protein
VGELADIAAVLLRMGYRSDRRNFDDDQRLFERRPDVVVRKSGDGAVPAHWIRFWVAPVTYRGRPVFVAQVGRPVGGRSVALRDGADLMLHPAVDEARNYLAQEVLYSGGLSRLGFVEGAGVMGAASAGEDPGHSRYATDGLRAVMFFVTRPVTLSEVEFLDWVK